MDWKLLSSTEFETLALSYARFKYKDYVWEPTNETRDDNHDFFYKELDEFQEEWEGRGRVRHRRKHNAPLKLQPQNRPLLLCREPR